MSAVQTRDQQSRGAPVEASQAELILAQIDSLPTLPAVATRLLELTSDDRSGAREVIQLIESDQSLSARILALARRANVATSVTTVERAVVILGFEAVRNLILSVQIFETFSHRKERQGARFNRVEFWKHSLAVACAARLLGQETAAVGRVARSGSPRPEEVFICGLLHDIGKVVLDACFPKSYDRVVAKVEERAGCIADVEREVFGLDHALVGSRLAMHWKLPAMIAETIWLHHNSPTATPSRLAHPEHVRLVQVADRLVRHMRIGYSGNQFLDEPLAVSAAAIGLSKESVERVMSALPELVEARAEFIGLDRLTSKDVYEGALARANEELARMNDSLTETNRRLHQRSRCFEAINNLRAALGDVLTHERVVQAAAEALAGNLAEGTVSVLGYSQARSVYAVASCEPGGESLYRDVLPAGDAGDLGPLVEARAIWVPASVLPKTLLDRVMASLDAMPTWCYPIHDPNGFAGAIFVSGQKPADSDELVPVLADWIGAWLGASESTTVTRRLNEELAEINRRLLASQSELARARSLVMVGEMAAGAAHELNNPLAVISGRAQLLNRDGVDDDVRKAAVLISDHAHRASAIVNELMEFAKPASPQPEVVDLPQLMGEIRRAWIEKKAIPEAQFRLDLSDGLPSIRVDALQIRMLFDEVIRNAIEAMRETPEPLLVMNCRCDLADDRVVIRVQDNGCGMAPEVLERAIDPFFSHRPAGRGRGLGLSRAVRFAEINGGRVRIDSRPGAGTRVFVELPAVR